MALFQWQELKNSGGKMEIPFFKKRVPEAVKEQTNEIEKDYQTNKSVESILENNFGIMPKIVLLDKSVIDYSERLKEHYK